MLPYALGGGGPDGGGAPSEVQQQLECTLCSKFDPQLHGTPQGSWDLIFQPLPCWSPSSRSGVVFFLTSVIIYDLLQCLCLLFQPSNTCVANSLC